MNGLEYSEDLIDADLFDPERLPRHSIDGPDGRTADRRDECDR